MNTTTDELIVDTINDVIRDLRNIKDHAIFADVTDNKKVAGWLFDAAAILNGLGQDIHDEGSE